MFNIETKTENGIFVIELHGRLDAVGSKTAADELLDTIGEKEKVIIDMAECSYVSSAGLRFLLLTAKKARQSGCKAVLTGVRPLVWDVITMTGFENVLEAFATHEDAVAALDVVAQ